MKKILIIPMTICFALLISACNYKSGNSTAFESTSSHYSKSYQPPLFKSDNRVEKIRALAPEIHELIASHAEDRHIPGIAYGIVLDDQLVISGATGLMNLESNSPTSTNASYRIASMTKSFTAMAIIKLRDEGKLLLSDPAAKYIAEMSNLEYLTNDSPIINIENLLTMTAGFPEDNPWGDRQLHQSDEMLMGLMSDGVSFSNVPSYDYEYSNTGYALLGNIISRVSGVPYQQYIRENILQPLHMNDTYWEYDSISPNQLAIGYRWENDQWKLEPMLHDGSYGAMGGLITSIEDFSKYVSFHLSAWPPRSAVENGPIKRSSLREMHTPKFSALVSNSTDHNGELCPFVVGYGYGLGIRNNCNGVKRVSHGGALPGFGSNYVFYPEYGVGVMAFCNLTYTSPYPLNDINRLIFDKAAIQPRQLPVSDILRKRTGQVIQMIQEWDTALEKEILAENFYLDKSRAHRIEQVNDVLNQAGAIIKIDDIVPSNQLRGRFKMNAENGIISVFFTLTPEKDAKLQRLNVSFKPNDTI